MRTTGDQPKSQKSNEYEIPQLVTSENPEQMGEEVKEPPPAEPESDGVNLS